VAFLRGYGKGGEAAIHGEFNEEGILSRVYWIMLMRRLLQIQNRLILMFGFSPQ
jgi:hypothetical protein